MKDTYTLVTDRIIVELEAGTVPWHKPWTCAQPAIIRARIRSGMQNAKAKGRKVGRPRVTKEDIPTIFLRHYPELVSGKLNVSELARVCELSRPTVYKYLRLIG